MKLFIILLAVFFSYSCSFDDKTGIWKNNNNTIEVEDASVFKDFKNISATNSLFNKTITLSEDFEFSLDEPIISKLWGDNFYNKNNNTKNFKYNDLNQIILKTKKLTKNKTNNHILFENDNLVINDEKGNIVVYSVETNSILTKINFYKKNYKKVKKNLNLIIENNIIYVTDNIGYMYAYNYAIQKLIWAKKHKVPFRSNIKISKNKLITSNQNNDLFIFDKLNGNLVKQIPSEETVINNKFINNIAISEDSIFYLNTFGSLYSININSYKLNWFINLNKSLDLSLSNIFSGSDIVYYKEKILVSTNENFYQIDSNSGSVISKKNYPSLFKPLISNDYYFLITKNNFLVTLKPNSDDIIYSFEISQKVADFVGSKKKKLEIKDLMLINSSIFVFLNNAYIIKFNVKGDIEELVKLPSDLNSKPIIIDNSLLYLNNKNKLYVIN